MREEDQQKNRKKLIKINKKQREINDCRHKNKRRNKIKVREEVKCRQKNKQR